ncbi:hypothetical protein DdX_05102 [Ditylenchus destructor]|uniref:Uncharacterized protein n=1 Tax=Ditylenchus destructor TaxID=166010 RepID=A0AAD4RAD7_9BILA|nr:hypothetical protein DdX_05102 [Ditylenchus destructor]
MAAPSPTVWLGVRQPLNHTKASGTGTQAKNWLVELVREKRSGNREDFACIRLVLRLSHGLVGCQQPSLTAGYLPGHLDRVDWKDSFLSSPVEQGPTARRFPRHILNQFVMAVSMLTTTLFDCHQIHSYSHTVGSQQPDGRGSAMTAERDESGFEKGTDIRRAGDAAAAA